MTLENCKMRGCWERNNNDRQKATKLVVLEGNYGEGDKKAFLCDACYKIFVQVKYTFDLGRISTYTTEVPYEIIDTFS